MSLYLTKILFLSSDGQLKQVRFGFVDRDDEFRLAYEEGENDMTVFPSEVFI